MKKIIVSLIMTLFVFGMMACAPSNATQEEIIKRANDGPYELLVTAKIEDLSCYYFRTLGIIVTELCVEQEGETPKLIGHTTDDINITELEKVNKIQCLRKKSDNSVYSIHRSTLGILYYAFYSNLNGSWVSDKEVYCASKSLSQSDFADIEIGSSLTEVMNIDTSQKESFELFREVDASITYTTKHLTVDGLLTITYDKWKGGSALDPDKITVSSIEWSELPILEQDLPA